MLGTRSPFLILLALAGLGLTIAGQVTDWGVIGEGDPVPVLLRVFALLAAVLVALDVVLWSGAPPTLPRDGATRRHVVLGVAVVLAAIALGWTVTLVDTQVSARVGGWLAICGSAVVLVAGVIDFFSVRRGWLRCGAVAAAVAALVIAAGTIAGAVWWPSRDSVATTAAPQRPLARPSLDSMRWLRSSDTHFLGTFGGRPVASFTSGPHDGHGVACRGGAHAYDPVSGRVAWEYSVPSGCFDPGIAVAPDADLIRLRYLSTSDDPVVVYLDAATGRVLHPDHADGTVDAWAGRYGLSFESRSSTVPVVLARTGRPVGRFTVPQCSDGETSVQTLPTPHLDQDPDLTNGVLAGPVAAEGNHVAMSYTCQQDIDRIVQHVLVLDTRSGRQRDVPLPTPQAVLGAQPRTPATLLMTGGMIVLGYRSSEDDRVAVGIDAATGVVRWSHVDHDPLQVDASDDWAVAGSRIVTFYSVLDPRTGRTTPLRSDDGASTDSLAQGGRTLADGSFVRADVSRAGDWRLVLDVLDPRTGIVRRSTVVLPNWPRDDALTMIPGSTSSGAAFGANGIVISTN